ncbi:MAG TPA: SUMF1/EgtB/PvdO family nonheme iron enzyme [Anaerolineales bacterium]|nr:SUMF1/EgtB/PvdO family nonheme iron enzyme [Anaerolineales bacterium]
MDNLIGKHVDRYEILELLGTGGMAMVYKAYDARLEREVAIKIIRRSAFPPEVIDDMVKRFEREAKSLAKLSHANIVKVLDYGEFEGSPYLVMEYYPGGTLKEKMGEPVEWQDAARIILPVARGVEYAHDRGIIHRDIKPANILMNEKGDPTLSDFGIAKLLQGESKNNLTASGAAVGTPEYMAPEQWTGETSTKTDMYALGTILYEMITGRRPYVADTPGAVFLKQVTEPLPLPRKFNANLPEMVEEFLLKTLDKDPANRYEDFQAFIKELETLLGDDTLSSLEKASPKTTAEKGTQEKTSAQKTDRESPSKQENAPRKTFPLYAGIGGGVLLVILIAFFALRNNPTADTPSTETSAPSVDATVTATTAPVSNTEPTTGPQKLDIGSVIISEIDGMNLLYVPAGEFTMGNYADDALIDCEKGKSEALNEYNCSRELFLDEEPPTPVNLDAFWIDETEVTNEMYAECVAESVCAQPADISSSTNASYYNNPAFKHFPVIYVDWNMAKTYCEWAGRRLPTEAEWEKAARGTDSRVYPWGFAPPNSNLLSYSEGVYIRDTVEVAESPDGRSFYGAYDMAGNVYEWTNSAYEKYPYDPTDGREEFKAIDDLRIMRGGSWRSNNVDIRSANRYPALPTDTYNSGGIRCARSEQPGDALIPPTPIPTEIGKRNTENYGIGSTITGEDGATFVYVPAGKFIMGSDDGKADEQPVQELYLDAYWIGETEVTNKQYEACVNQGTCDPPASFASYNQKGYFGYPQYINYPVLYVSWDQAKTYCTWAGGRLPTEAEWEKAARGTEGQTYPWGNATPNSNLLNYNSDLFDTSEVKKYPDGQSIYGAYDMAGNVWEWVSSIYRPYPYNSLDGREDMTLEAERVLRGGSWLVSDADVRASNRYYSSQKETFNNLTGFRCARSE